MAELARSPDSRIPADANFFGPAAGDYERARPSYPEGVLGELRSVAGLGPGCRVLDLAAGTGKLTRLLAATGASVEAVEPVPGMRAELERAVPGVPVHDGTAEVTGVASASFDLVTVAQAFHWFRFDEAVPEISRVLRPGGTLAIVFNERDAREPWVAEWNEVLEWHQRTIATYQGTDWTEVLTGGGLSAVGSATFEWSEPMTRADLAARVRSVSYVASQPPAEQARLADAVVALVGNRPEPFPLPYRTHLWWARTAEPGAVSAHQ